MWEMEGGDLTELCELVDIAMQQRGVLPFGPRTRPLSKFSIGNSYEEITPKEITWYHNWGTFSNMMRNNLSYNIEARQI